MSQFTSHQEGIVQRTKKKKKEASFLGNLRNKGKEVISTLKSIYKGVLSLVVSLMANVREEEAALRNVYQLFNLFNFCFCQESDVFGFARIFSAPKFSIVL